MIFKLLRQNKLALIKGENTLAAAELRSTAVPQILACQLVAG